MSTAALRVNSGGGGGARVNLKPSPSEPPKQASESTSGGEAEIREKLQTTADGEKKVAWEKDDRTASAPAAAVKTGGGGGLYVKRSQPPRVTTVTSISSSKILPSYQQLEPPAPATTVAATFSSSRVLTSTRMSVQPVVAVSGSLTTASPSSHVIPHASNTPAAPPQPPPSSVVVVVAPGTQVLKSDTPALLTSSSTSSSTAPTLHPLQISSANPGVSKSQTLAGEPMSYKEFRALPSVKLLAKSFGSTTALNTISTNSTASPAPRLSSSQSNLFRGSPLVRSYSSVSISDPPKQTSSTNIIFVKGTAAEQRPPHQQQQQPLQAPVIVNGKPPVPHTSMKSQTATSKLTATSTALNASSGATELELARARLKTNRLSRDAAQNRSDDSSYNSNNSEPSKTADTAISHGESQKYSTYTKKKDSAPFKINTANANTIQISNGVARIANPVRPAPVTATAEDGASSSASSVASSTSATLGSAAGYFKRPQLRPADDSRSRPAPLSTAPVQAPSGPERVVSTATVTIRRAKSKEELQEESRQVMTAKDSLLKQIQARRRDDYDNGSGGSNVLSMSKLSQSMPSLLHDGRETGDGSKSFPIKSSIVMPELDYKSPLSGPEHEDDLALETDDNSSRMNLRNWDPNSVVSLLYQIKMKEEEIEDISHQYITMEGLMEKLPINKKKATLLKTWKRRYFKAQDGWLHYYEGANRDEASESIQLMGGEIHDMGNRVLGIDDGRGRYLMVRCPTEKEYGQWKLSLESQTADNTKATYIKPVLKSSKNPNKKVVLIDLGSSAVRAGVLGSQASLPEVFFPSILAVDRETGQVVAVGTDALKPDVRSKCKIVHPIRPSNKVDQNIIRPFNIELQYMESVFNYIFTQLNVVAADYWAMVSTPQNLADSLKKGLMEHLVDKFNMKGVCMVQQSLLSLYSYKATSGIILDIGHRIEVLPIFEGFVIEGGVARCPFGGQKVQESLTISLLENNYKFSSITEQWLVRYIMEQSCYVAIDYNQELDWCKTKPDILKTSINLSKFDLPDGSYQSVQHDVSRFKSPEGFFNTDMWELDYPTIPKLIHQAIQSCPMDNRRHMWRAVYLSGGVTMLPGFSERLEKELTKLAPPGVPVEVHAAPQRYHCAYIGAAAVSLMPQFEQMSISREEWKRENVRAFSKWQAPKS